MVRCHRIFDTAQVNVELVSGFLTLTQPSEVAAYADTFAAMDKLAVYGIEARALIKAAMDSRTYGTGHGRVVA
ncbi:hypothetical protein OG352_23760 [Streptomyces sp. NBC_01485]|nr:hypothetical protein [Streptomyces sp. NBC_01485]